MFKKNKLFQVFLAAFFLLAANAQAAETPSLIIKTFDGKSFDLSKQKGKIVIVNFWAQWCIDCRKELPILDEIYAKYKSRGVEIIGASVDDEDDLDKVLQLVKDKKYPNALLANAYKNNFDEPQFLPTSYILDGSGKIRAKMVSDDKAITKKDFEKILDSMPN